MDFTSLEIFGFWQLASGLWPLAGFCFRVLGFGSAGFGSAQPAVRAVGISFSRWLSGVETTGRRISNLESLLSGKKREILRYRSG